MTRLATTLCALFLVLAAPAPAAEWLAGDGHVHTCYSHDSYCPMSDDNTGPETFYSSAATVPQRFTEAAAKGLDFLVISDHNDVRAWGDPGFGTNGVVGVRAYEHSLPGGHAHVLGAKRLHTAADAQALATSARADGSMFQINHPTDKGRTELAGCEEIAAGGRGNMHWEYGFTARPDTLEVWNATTLIRPAEVFWECWLQQGARVPVTSGSDSHGGNQANLGMPTLWVLAKDRSEASILAALRAGRTTVTRLAPAQGAARLLLEADADRDGVYEATMGDTVPPGTPMRARSDRLSAFATVRIRANGETLAEEPLAPGGAVTFDAPARSGWVRASMLGEQGTFSVDPNCRRDTPSPLDVCSADLAILAMTSPLYIAAQDASAPEQQKKPKKQKQKTKAGRARAQAHRPDEAAHADEPDDGPPLEAAFQSDDGAPLPSVPRFSLRARTGK